MIIPIGRMQDGDLAAIVTWDYHDGYRGTIVQRVGDSLAIVGAGEWWTGIFPRCQEWLRHNVMPITPGGAWEGSGEYRELSEVNDAVLMAATFPEGHEFYDKIWPCFKLHGNPILLGQTEEFSSGWFDSYRGCLSFRLYRPGDEVQLCEV